jgi:hypothetical protein
MINAHLCNNASDDAPDEWEKHMSILQCMVHHCIPDCSSLIVEQFEEDDPETGLAYGHEEIWSPSGVL